MTLMQSKTDRPRRFQFILTSARRDGIAFIRCACTVGHLQDAQRAELAG